MADENQIANKHQVGEVRGYGIVGYGSDSSDDPEPALGLPILAKARNENDMVDEIVNLADQNDAHINILAGGIKPYGMKI